MMKIISWLFSINVVLIFLCGGLWLYAQRVAPVDTNMQITELDRHRVFHETNLKKFNPQLAENLRYNLGPWIVRHERHVALWASGGSFFMAVFNSLGLLWVKFLLSRLPKH